jgi:DNA-directed RNA polymerase specialized sigma24 family protein
VKGEQERPEIFAQRFLRSYRLLHFIACRVLGDDEIAPIAIQNCWRTASRDSPHFEYEGAFRSWLVRVLIDEALAILCGSQRQKNPTDTIVNTAFLSDRTRRPELD